MSRVRYFCTQRKEAPRTEEHSVWDAEELHG